MKEWNSRKIHFYEDGLAILGFDRDLSIDEVMDFIEGFTAEVDDRCGDIIDRSNNDLLNIEVSFANGEEHFVVEYCSGGYPTKSCTILGFYNNGQYQNEPNELFLEYEASNIEKEEYRIIHDVVMDLFREAF